jgi:CRISPR-associated protein Cas1
MAALAYTFPAPRQYNFLTESYEAEPEQLSFAFPEEPEERWPEHVALLATENGAQFYCSGFGMFLGKKSERLTVKEKGKTIGEIPLFRLQEIVIGSRGVTLSVDLIEAACERGVRIAMLGASGRPFALLTSPMLTATVETRKAQFTALGDERGAGLARMLVAGKLRNQEKLLRYFARNRDHDRQSRVLTAAKQLRGLRAKVLAFPGSTPDEVRAGLMGLEGTGGRIYWDQWVDILPERLEFQGRRHQGASDAVNACLNYGYGILTSHVWGAVLNAGLEPFAGFLHTDRSGKPSLALDLVEEFRQPVVDRAIFGWVLKGGAPSLDRAGMLDGPTKEQVAERVLARLNIAELHRGKSHQVRSIIQMQARLLASAVRRMRNYRPWPFTW